MQRTKQQRRLFTRKYVEKQKRLYKTYHQHVWWSGYIIEPHDTGRWKKHSFCDTGGCECCKNPRRVKWNPICNRITLQERRNDDAFNDQLDDYYCDDFC